MRSENLATEILRREKRHTVFWFIVSVLMFLTVIAERVKKMKFGVDN